MRNSLVRCLQVVGVCLLGGCVTGECDPKNMVPKCRAEQLAVAAGKRVDTPSCWSFDTTIGDSRNEDLSNQGAGGSPGGGTGGSPGL
jgi:hypothetical protein